MPTCCTGEPHCNNSIIIINKIIIIIRLQLLGVQSIKSLCCIPPPPFPPTHTLKTQHQHSRAADERSHLATMMHEWPHMPDCASCRVALAKQTAPEHAGANDIADGISYILQHAFKLSQVQVTHEGCQWRTDAVLPMCTPMHDTVRMCCWQQDAQHPQHEHEPACTTFTTATFGSDCTGQHGTCCETALPQLLHPRTYQPCTTCYTLLMYTCWIGFRLPDRLLT
jgi:hypothetical protein